MKPRRLGHLQGGAVMGFIRRFSQRPRGLRLTKEGKFFALLVCAVAFGAFNTGNNLLYLLLSAMLTMILVSVVLAGVSLRGVEVWRRPPEEIYAGQETFVTLGVRNHKAHLPSFNLAVCETFGRGRELDPVSFVYLGPAESSKQGYRCIFPRRGRCRFRGWSVETGFPFGLLLRGLQLEGRDRAVVYPPVLPIERLPVLVGSGQSGESASRAGEGEEFFSLRVFRRGDDHRRIAWKASAHRRVRLLRESEREAVQQFEVVVIEVGSDERHDPLIEAVVVHAASLAVHYINEGYCVGLTTLRRSVPAGTGRQQQRLILTELALLRHLSVEDEEVASLVAALPLERRGCSRIVVCAPCARALHCPRGPQTTIVEVEAPLAPSLVQGVDAPADASPESSVTPALSSSDTGR